MSYIDSNALNLADYALQSNDPLIREVAMSMIKAGSAWQDIPVITDETLKSTYARIIGALPKVNWTPLNSEPIVVKTDPQQREEGFYFFRNSMQFDEYLLRDKNAIDDPRDIQIKSYLEAVTYDLNDALINNTQVNRAGRNRATNENCFTGLRERLDDAQYGMVTADLKVASTANMSDAGITATQANILIRQIQARLDAMGFPDGDGCSIYMNDDLVARIEFGIRALGAGGGFDMAKDAFDRTVLMYRNAKIRRIGRKAPDATGNQPYVITSTETADGGKDTGGVYTSLYVVAWDRMSAYAWQFDPPTVKPEFYLPNGVVKQIVVQGGYGVKFPNNRSISRLYGIQVA